MTLQRNIGRGIVSPLLLRGKFQQDNARFHVSAETMTLFGNMYGCGDRLAVTVFGCECYREFVWQF